MFPSVQLKKTIFLRLSKILSLSSITSRNKAQELIKSGRVKVNKQVINQNVLVDAKSDIEVDGIPIKVDLTTRLWAIYKPKHVFCNTEQNYQYEEKKETNENGGRKEEKIQNRKCLFHNNILENTKINENSFKRLLENPLENSLEKGFIVKKDSLIQRGIENENEALQNTLQNAKTNDGVTRKNPLKLNINIFDFIRKKNILYEEKHKVKNFIPEHLITINNLDASSEGLILFTNDGDFANNLKNVENKILTSYLLKTQGKLTSEKLQLLQKGSVINNTFIKPISIEIIKSNFSNNWLKFTYVEKSKIYLTLLFEKFQLYIKKCKRISFGPYKLSDISPDIFMPLKIHATFTPFIPLYKEKWILTQPKGYIQTDLADNGQKKYLYIKDYLKNSMLIKTEKIHKKDKDVIEKN